MKRTPIYLINFIFWSIIILSCNSTAETEKLEKKETPTKIVNIVNFIRQIEPRDENITNEVLYQTVVKQLKSMKRSILSS